MAVPSRAGHHLVGKRSLVAISHAIEATLDDTGAAGVVVLALFERARYFEVERPRYERMAAEGAVVAVGFAGEPLVRPAGIPVVRLDADHPMASEWTVVVVAPLHGAALRAVDRRSVLPDEETLEAARAFDARWTFDRRDAVREARRLLPLVAPVMTAQAAAVAEATMEQAHRAPLGEEERRLARVVATLVHGMEREADRSRAQVRAARVHDDVDADTGLASPARLARYLGNLRPGPPLPDLGVLRVRVEGHDGSVPTDEGRRKAAALVLATLRATDLAVRWDDEEIVVLAPGLAGGELDALADRLVQASHDGVRMVVRPGPSIDEMVRAR